jgi:hypothetical protein
MQFTILFQNLEALSEKFEKLNQKCLKYGNEQLSYIPGDIFTENGKDYINIEVSGMVPVIGDYKLISVISKLEDGTNLICTIPGEELPVQFRENQFFCDHCQTNRYRKEVVIVRDTQGKYVQLGKTCLKDYLGESLENLVNKFSYINELITEANDENFCGSGPVTITAIKYLEYVALAVRKIGYIKSDSEDRKPTKYMALDLYYPRRDTYKLIRELDLYVTDEDKKMASDALDYVKTIDNSSEYYYNLKAIVSQKFNTTKHIGFLASIIPVYQKHLGIIEASKNKLVSEFVGNPKDRLISKAKVVFTKEIDGNYGLKTLVKFVTDKGENLTWFASGSTEFKIGKEYDIKFTVKKHEMYNNEKQTMVNRVVQC